MTPETPVVPGRQVGATGPGGTEAGFDMRLVIGILALVAGAVALGIGTALAPALTALIAAAGVVVIGLLIAGTRVSRVFLVLLAVMLVGYAFLGRGFAYLGIAPLYLGELALPVALLALLRGRQPGRFGPIHLLLLAFVAWGALQTIPYLAIHGIDALRDGVTWGYAAYALVVSLILSSDHLRMGTAIYRRLIPIFLVWVPVAAVASQVVALPATPGSDVPILVFKGGDVGVHLAGIAAFVFLGLYAQGRGWRAAEPVLWALWLVAVGVAGVLNRGGLVAASTAAAAVLYVRAAGRALTMVFVALVLIVPLILIDPRIEIGLQREISVGQMLDNLTSLVSEGDDPGLEGTERFRVRWWTTIVDYTIGGPYFWTGKGYGVNLADDDGFQVTEDGSLRAPHNGHIEILARSGVPGVLLWMALNAAYGFSLLRAAARARSRGAMTWVRLLGFAFIYWLAALVNASFDPYLQGPQGGIWFWTMVGVGLASIRMSDRQESIDEA